MSLRPILEKIKNAPPGQSLAIFDLDSTLYDLSKRVSAIMHRFANDPEIAARFPDALKSLQPLEIRRTDWGIHEPFHRAGVISGRHDEFLKAAQEAWRIGFFSNEFLHHDFPLPGAVEFVRKCLEKGAHVLYLTGRDTERMAAGTEASLRQHSFPFEIENVRLHLKPDRSLDDAEFKASATAEASKNYQQVWLFENEPVNINAVLKRVPFAQTVFIDTCHSGIEQAPSTSVVIKTFSLDADLDLERKT